MTSRKKTQTPADVELLDDNPTHEVQLVEDASMDIPEGPTVLIDSKVVAATAAIPGGTVAVTFVDGSTAIHPQSEVPYEINPFLTGGDGITQIPVYLNS